ncbi:hypothetical protein [Geobacter pickeringii]|uniref:hypothetical protein n=1 Tax=Geobacter pickeringii TaxID=345632 RepID=UPI000A3EEA3F|nr:hypothetical protein [Geobacter pickeringii]
MNDLMRSTVIAGIVLAALPALGQEDVRGWTFRQQGIRVLDEKCVACHNRQRIEAAVRERKDMEQITRRMEQKGAKLSEGDRSVLGVFWKQNPFKGAGKAPPSATEPAPPSH